MLRIGVLAVVLVATALPAAAQSGRSAGMDMAKTVGEAETLAAACRLRLDSHVRDTLRDGALSKINGSTLYRMERLAQAYTRNELKRDRQAACTRALIQFGPEGTHIRHLVLHLDGPRRHRDTNDDLLGYFTAAIVSN